ncbi:DUF1127 domain-containing protein [Yoonia sp. F2084L]|uniref:DUF1127 domain-containing protein n=1 Tax=Yoonia sp. F2084L TaxID=2926419 RepID=UPI001FF3A2C1|nr:DUF1127 domain-containing protein [Yoonia sp. F2084L]
MSISAHTAIQHTNCEPKPLGLWAKLGQMLAAGKQRRQLRAADDHLLADIGITRHEAESEARQPMWNVPNHWRN